LQNRPPILRRDDLTSAEPAAGASAPGKPQPHGSAVRDSSSAAKVELEVVAATGFAAPAVLAGLLTDGGGSVGVGTAVGVAAGQITGVVGAGDVAVDADVVAAAVVAADVAVLVLVVGRLLVVVD